MLTGRTLHILVPFGHRKSNVTVTQQSATQSALQDTHKGGQQKRKGTKLTTSTRPTGLGSNLSDGFLAAGMKHPERQR